MYVADQATKKQGAKGPAIKKHDAWCHTQTSQSSGDGSSFGLCSMSNSSMWMQATEICCLCQCFCFRFPADLDRERETPARLCSFSSSCFLGSWLAAPPTRSKVCLPATLDPWSIVQICSASAWPQSQWCFARVFPLVFLARVFL